MDSERPSGRSGRAVVHEEDIAFGIEQIVGPAVERTAEPEGRPRRHLAQPLDVERVGGLAVQRLEPFVGAHAHGTAEAGRPSRPGPDHVGAPRPAMEPRVDDGTVPVDEAIQAEEFRAFMKAESAKWARVIKEANIRVD